MCKEVIKQSRIKKVQYFLGNNKKINYKTSFEQVNELNKEEINYFEKELKKFFENMR